jgi:hypothetical protein
MAKNISSKSNSLHSELNDYIPRSYSRSLKIKFYKIRHSKIDSSPYLSGDSFANLTEYIAYGIKRRENLDLIKLQNANSVFVPGDLLDKFLKESDGYLRAKVLISGNSDQNFSKLLSLPKSIRYWYCQNNAVLNSVIIKTLPIGLENARLGRLKLLKLDKKCLTTARIDQILVPPMSITNKMRISAISEALKYPEIFNVQRRMIDETEYSKLNRKYRFILCCEGNGYDSHRVWETLYRGSFPVLLNSNWAQSLKYLNLPILIIDSFKAVNKKKLVQFANQYSDYDPVSTKCLWTPYWKELIGNHINHSN